MRVACITVGLVSFLLTSNCPSSQPVTSVGHPSPRGAPVIKVGEEQLEATTGTSGARVNRPYFDAGGRLRWNELPPDASSPCPDGTPETERTTLMLDPRVDRVRCPHEGSAKGSKAFLVGLDETGKTVWRRLLGFVSGKFTIEEEVIGASREGVVLSDLTVIVPRTGDVLVPPPTHPVGQEQRPVPDHDLTGSGLYLPDRRGILWFSADVTLIKRKGGLFFIEATTGRKELWLPVSATLAGGYWRVEEMAPARDGRHVFLAQKFAIRGPGGVSLAAFDLERREIVCEDRFGEGHFCDHPQVVPGPGDSFGLAYLDATAGKRVLVHYRLHKD